MPARPTLYERCQGPGAVPLGALIAKADLSVAKLQERYGQDFLTLADHIEDVARDAFADSASAPRRNRLLAAILDGASSAATAGYAWVSAIAEHLYECLERQGLQNADSRRLFDLHLDAMRGAAKSRSADWSKVLDELRQAASIRAHRQGRQSE